MRIQAGLLRMRPGNPALPPVLQARSRAAHLHPLQ